MVLQPTDDGKVELLKRAIDSRKDRNDMEH